METPAKLSPEVVSRLRALAHDLSNSLETVMQASYLLAQAPMDNGNKRWVQLLEEAGREAARLNREIRELLRSHHSG
jgi:signal transduction histidine kinase